MRRHSDLLEPCAGKLASTVLRGEGDSNVPALPDYWSELHSKLYDGETSKDLKRQNHKCGECGLKMLGDERVNLHHVDGNHSNSKINNLLAVHSYLPRLYPHEAKQKQRTSGAGCGETSRSGSNSEVRRIIPPIDSTRAKIRDYDIPQARLHCKTHRIF